MVTLDDVASGISNLRNQRFLRARSALRRITTMLIRRYHVKKIILIGSLADKDHFGFHSDIDLCVEGLPDKLYFKAVGDLLSAADEFDVDIIPIENAARSMRGKIEKGKVLYEKR